MFGMIFANLRHRKLRTITSVLAVAFTVALVVVTFACQRRVRETTNNWPSALIIRNVSDDLLPHAYAEKLKTVPGVEQVEYLMFMSASDEEGKYVFYADYTSPGYIPHFYGPLSPMDPEVEKRWKADRIGFVSDRLSAEHFGWKVGEEYTVKTKTGPVRGRYQGAWYGPLVNSTKWHYEYRNELAPEGVKDNIYWFAVPCAPERCSEVGAAIEEAFKDEAFPVWTIIINNMFMTFIAPELSATALLTGISAFLLFMTAMITATTLAMSMRERQGELGTLRALGFTRFQVARMVVMEALVVSLIGAVLGSIPLVLYFSDHGMNLGPQIMANITLGGVDIAAGLLFAFPFALMVSVWPAIGAARLDVVHALIEG